MQAPWHVIWTRPSAEFATVERLDDEGFNALCPAILKLVTIGGARRFWRGKIARQEIVKLPAFPRYVFYSPTPKQPLWQLARKVDGVTAIMHPAGQPDDPWIVPRKVLELLRGEKGDGIIEDETHLLKSMERYAYATRVRVTSGSFAHQVGTVVGDDGRKVKILMSVLGREAPIELPRQIVQPVT
jgi:transcription antitermination factor NusG